MALEATGGKLERKTGAVVLWLLLAASASVSATEGTASDSAQPVKSAAADPRVCKRVKATGTRITQRVCMKQSEWDSIAENAKRSMEDRRYLESSTRLHAPE